MNCNECITANPINRCAATIYIPHVSGPQNEDYRVTIKDTSTGRIDAYDVTAVGHSLTVTLTQGLFPSHIYEIKAYHNSDYNDAHTLTVGAESGCCIQFETADFNVGGDTDEVLSVSGCNSNTND